MTRRLRTLCGDDSGTTMLEFGILAPAIITLMLGVLQIGLWMQSYNALRSVAADTGRYVTVEYQKSNRISNVNMALWARTHAINNYMFKSALISTNVTDAAAQPISGVTEKTLTLNYTMTSILGVAGVADIPVSFQRPIFVKTI